MANLVEAKTGKEWHSSACGEFYIHGLALVAENFNKGKHQSYREAAAEVPDGTIFTVWDRSGDKHGTNSNDYYVLLADASQEPQEITGGCYRSGGYVRGRWQVLAHGDGKVRAPRLLGWVKAQGGIEKVSEALARHLGSEIHRRGILEPAPLGQ